MVLKALTAEQDPGHLVRLTVRNQTLLSPAAQELLRTGGAWQPEPDFVSVVKEQSRTGRWARPFCSRDRGDTVVFSTAKQKAPVQDTSTLPTRRHRLE